MSSTKKIDLFIIIQSVLLIALAIFFLLGIEDEAPKMIQGIEYDHEEFISSLGFDPATYITQLQKEPETDSAEVVYIIAKIESNRTKQCQASSLFEKKRTQSLLQEIVIAETLAELDCKNTRKQDLEFAANAWEQFGASWRARIYRSIAKNQTPNITVEGSWFHPNIESLKEQARGAEKVILGDKSIAITSKDKILSQTDRTRRDWLSYQVYDPFEDKDQLLRTFSERLSYESEELREDIGWHEGARTQLLLDLSSDAFEPAISVLAARKEGVWYAPDENGVFRFQIPEDKIMYPTTRFLTKDVAVIIDTHGMNMMVEQAIRTNATLIYADCDHPGKAKAAKYLEQKGKKVVCTVDRFTHTLLGHKINIMGNPPIMKSIQGAILGNRSMAINQNDSIIVMNSSLFYYDTAAKYFEILEQVFPLKTIYVQTNNVGAMEKVVQIARLKKSMIIAGRVFHSSDYYPLKSWLEESKEHKAILFHTYPYPYGFKIFHEFENQTTFNDPNPRFIVYES